MNNLTLTCKDSGDFKPHPEGIHPAVCLDVMDLGLVETDFQGQKKLVNKVKITFESEAKTDDGKRCSVSKSFTASLHPKAKLAEFIGKWRGRPVLPGETIDLQKLVGACCTLVISHQKNLSGKIYASIDAVSKPTRMVAPSGLYDPAVARKRYADWCSRQMGNHPTAGADPRSAGIHRTEAGQVAAPLANSPAHNAAAPSKSDAGATRTGQPAAPAFDPEVGF